MNKTCSFWQKGQIKQSNMSHCRTAEGNGEKTGPSPKLRSCSFHCEIQNSWPWFCLPVCVHYGPGILPPPHSATLIFIHPVLPQALTLCYVCVRPEQPQVKGGAVCSAAGAWEPSTEQSRVRVGSYLSVREMHRRGGVIYTFVYLCVHHYFRQASITYM